jgi:hypothetical protein
MFEMMPCGTQKFQIAFWTFKPTSIKYSLIHTNGDYVKETNMGKLHAWLIWKKNIQQKIC